VTVVELTMYLHANKTIYWRILSPFFLRNFPCYRWRISLFLCC